MMFLTDLTDLTENLHFRLPARVRACEIDTGKSVRSVRSVRKPAFGSFRVTCVYGGLRRMSFAALKQYQCLNRRDKQNPGDLTCW
jgi:hypothetical protein